MRCDLKLIAVLCLWSLESQCYEKTRHRTVQRFITNKRPVNLAPLYKDDHLLYAKEGNWKPMAIQHTPAHSVKKPRPQYQATQSPTDVTEHTTEHEPAANATRPMSNVRDRRKPSQKPKRRQEGAPHYEVHEDVDDFPATKPAGRPHAKVQDFSRKSVKGPVYYRKGPYVRYHLPKETIIQRHYRKPDVHHGILRPIKRIL